MRYKPVHRSRPAGCASPTDGRTAGRPSSLGRYACFGGRICWQRAGRSARPAVTAVLEVDQGVAFLDAELSHQGTGGGGKWCFGAEKS